MPTLNLLYQKQIPITKSIHIVIPTVGQVIDNEDEYYGLVSALTAMPIDLMVSLEDSGIDFTSINEYDLFLLLFPGLKDKDTSLVFGDLDLSKFQMGFDEERKRMVLVDSENDIVIDWRVQQMIASTLRRIHHLKKDNRKPANAEAKEYLLERERVKQARRRQRKQESQLEMLITAMVNTEQYKYDFETTRDLSIYQFNESVKQIIKKVEYEHRMNGVYAGTINPKEFSQDDLNWLTHK